MKEDDYTHPTTMYGCNKLYCEHLGHYYARHYKQLAAEPAAGKVDFRCVRFPGLISAVTMPSGGTSDYAPEMIHAAAKGKPYACFVRPDTRIPFMAMPDGVERCCTLAAAPRGEADAHRLQRRGVQPVRRGDARRGACEAFPDARDHWEVDEKRQGIVDTWPADVDDPPRGATGASPRGYDFDARSSEYLDSRRSGSGTSELTAAGRSAEADLESPAF